MVDSRLVVLSLAAATLLGACASVRPVASAAATPPPATSAAGATATSSAPVAPLAPAAPVAPADPPADDNLDAVAWVRLAAEHHLVFSEIYRAAEQGMLASLSDPGWDAIAQDEREIAATGLPPAVILDVDETVLDNSPYEAELIRTGANYGEFSWAEWCRKETAKALPGAVGFARLAAEHGVAIFYVSNRAKDLEVATLANLRQVGMPVASDASFLGLGTVVPGCEQVGSDKSCRRRLVARQFRVLAQFGDQLDDFADVVSNTSEGRASWATTYAGWFGERWWMFPNPMYGAWLPAHFDNDWSQPVATRRRALVDAIQVH